MEPATPRTLAALESQVDAALRARDWRRLEALGQALLAQGGAAARAHFLMGVAALEQRALRGALESLGRAVQLSPQEPEILALWARALAGAARMDEALAAVARLMQLKPVSAQAWDIAGVVFSQAGQHAPAADCFRSAAALASGTAAHRFNLASALKFLGRFDEAEAAYEACIALDPLAWKAHHGLAQLRRAQPGREHLVRLRSLLPQARDADAALLLRHALAKECEDLGLYDEAFAHWQAGKRPKRAQLGYHYEQDAALFAALRRGFSAAAVAGPGWEDPAPIFVVGMPRSGTTLVDRILSSHPQVTSVGESQNLPLLLKRAAGTTSPQVLDEPTVRAALGTDRAALGRRYVEATRPRGGAVRPRFVDKLPHNFLYLGFIAEALPQARIVCLRRHALDTCVGNYRQLFAVGHSYYGYALDLLDCGRYYADFDRLMRFWRRRYPGRIHELHYEALVQDQRAETQRLLEFCGLPWDDRCLDFQDNAAPVSTASSVQVRSALNREGLGRWRRYRAHLDGLMALLEAEACALEIPQAAPTAAQDSRLPADEHGQPSERATSNARAARQGEPGQAPA